jgi:cob(I)alamin adenosyltransferase
VGDEARPVRIYTGTGDDGTTGLLYGGRVAKDDPVIDANGAVDEAQATLGLIRAEAERGSQLDELLVELERELYVLMAEVATAHDNRHKLTPGVTLVTAEMVAALAHRADDLGQHYTMPSEFVLPGQNRVAALCDVARTVIRRAERLAIAVVAPGSQVVPYLNRLSSLLWAMARWQEEGHALPSRTRGRAGAPAVNEES